MGALKAILEIENKVFEVMSLDYEFNVPCSNNKKPSQTAAQGGMINFTIRSPLQTTFLFHEWLLDPKQKKEGHFRLPITYRDKQESKSISFYLAHCINLHESYNFSDSSQMYMRITIIAAAIVFGDSVAFKQPWLVGDDYKYVFPETDPKK